MASEEVAYPPEPWRLAGQLHASVFRVPTDDLPASQPPGTRPVLIGGHGIVIAAWVRYEAGSVLRYRELLCTVLVRDGGRIRPTISHIWVDSEASRRGGRELWGIPKQLAEFPGWSDRFVATDSDGEIATATIRARWRSPIRLPYRFCVVQTHRGRALASSVRGTAFVQLSQLRWRIREDGPLGFLAGRTPLASVSAVDFRMRFGRER